jgi:hypothetical protein
MADRGRFRCRVRPLRGVANCSTECSPDPRAFGTCFGVPTPRSREFEAVWAPERCLILQPVSRPSSGRQWSPMTCVPHGIADRAVRGNGPPREPPRKT